MTLREKISSDYNLIFGRQWPVWVGGLAIGVVNVFLFMFYQPWTTLDGVLNWGDWTLSRMGIIIADPLSPLLRSGSIINFGLLFGAFLSALLSRQFGVRVGPARELAKGALGGVLIGIGAVLVRGCNIGGFFSGTSALGAHGLMMALGLAVGAFIGARFLMWELNLPQRPRKAASGEQSSRRPAFLSTNKSQPWIGLVIAVAFLGAALAYVQAGYPDRAVILLFGGLLGIITQRSRVCFVRAFREPFITGDASHTKAMLLGLLVSAAGFAIVKYILIERVDEFVRATFWLGSLGGGVIFGIGMVLAGGCGGGTIWRVGEGHVKLWMTLITYIFSASLMNEWLINSGTIDQLGRELFLPDALGWAGTLLGLLGLCIIWYLVVQWNELTGKLAAV